MKVRFVLNNYQMGAKLKTAPTDKIISQVRLDRSHTEVIFKDVTSREVDFMEKLFAKKATLIV